MRMLDDFQRWGARCLGPERCRRIIRQVAHLAGIDLLALAHHDMGILKYQDLEVTGEAFLVRNVLPRLISKPTPVLVDVGANVGEFSTLLRAHFPAAAIYAFEPVADTFAQLRDRLAGLDVHCLNVGLGSKEESVPIYRSARGELNSLASLYPVVAQSVHQFQDTVVETIRIRTLDSVASEQKLDFVDLLKVDTEGHEYEVLQGARDLIRAQRVGVVLFEFNEMNVVSRVFLRDFYDCLAGYRFYRLDSRRLIPLGRYRARNEIFLFQNIVAIHSALHPAEV